MNKRGQIFLIAALVIVGILAGLVTIYNTTRSSSEDITVYDLSKEINFESSQVLDHGILYSTPSEQSGNNIKNLTDYYAKTNSGNEIIIAYGTTDKMTIIIYNSSNKGTIGIDFGGT